MARPVTITKALTAASATTIALSQTPLAAGNLTLNGASASGGVATLDTQRRVIITSAGNDTGRTFTVYGTNGSGSPIYEAVTGASGGAASTTLDFKTVTRIAVDAATASSVTSGTNGVGSTHWVAITPHISQAQLSTAVEVVSGSVNFTVEYTYQDVNNSPTSFYAYQQDNVIPTVWTDGVVTGATANAVATTNDPIWAARTTINSGTGTLRATFLQAGIAGN